MRSHPLARRSPGFMPVAIAAAVIGSGCTVSARPAPVDAPDTTSVASKGAIIAAEDGEHLILRGRKPITLKIDPASVGSQHLFLGTELMPPGDSIPAHRHLGEEEAVFVHRGVVQVTLADRTATAGAGATVFIPRATWIAIRNTSPDTAEIVYVFNEPAFDHCLRGFSVPAGRPYTEPAPDSADRIRRLCHQEVHAQH